ncbi:MAG: hypothetical protein KKF65_01070 [Nanoarchaeota archaeon]|nr:hypothetical protein [Nanoarchaeota archaeon]
MKAYAFWSRVNEVVSGKSDKELHLTRVLFGKVDEKGDFTEKHVVRHGFEIVEGEKLDKVVQSMFNSQQVMPYGSYLRYLSIRLNAENKNIKSNYQTLRTNFLSKRKVTLKRLNQIKSLESKIKAEGIMPEYIDEKSLVYLDALVKTIELVEKVILNKFELKFKSDDARTKYFSLITSTEESHITNYFSLQDKCSKKNIKRPVQMSSGFKKVKELLDYLNLDASHRKKKDLKPHLTDEYFVNVGNHRSSKKKSVDEISDRLKPDYRIRDIISYIQSYVDINGGVVPKSNVSFMNFLSKETNLNSGTIRKYVNGDADCDLDLRIFEEFKENVEQGKVPLSISYFRRKNEVVSGSVNWETKDGILVYLPSIPKDLIIDTEAKKLFHKQFGLCDITTVYSKANRLDIKDEQGTVHTVVTDYKKR